MRSYHILFLLAALSAPLNTSPYYYRILPTHPYLNADPTYLTQASPQACRADCQSCQIQSLACEQCSTPYYAKTAGGTCQLSPSYTLQSSSNEMQPAVGFVIAAQSWNNYKLTNCSALNTNAAFTAELVAIQPMNSSQRLQYSRTLSLHSYIIVTLLCIATDWSNSSSLSFSFSDEGGNKIIEDVKQGYLPNVAKQSLCSPTAVDQRFSITFKIPNNNSSSISISMAAEAASFSVLSWAVLSGLCHPTCSSCSYATHPNACLACNHFLKPNPDGSCSQCPPGFQLVKNRHFTFCQKCPIQYQHCSQLQNTCYYSEFNATTANNCSLTYDGSFYDELYEINEQIFAGSLFTVGGLLSPSAYVACGRQGPSSYTYVGQAQAFEPITRIFASLRRHISFSISFNLFVVDMGSPSQTMKFQIYVNSNLYDVEYLAVVGMSNLCGGQGLESFLTFPPTRFFPSTHADNLNLTILATAPWGIRNLRIVFQICDQSCLKCGKHACLQCMGILQLTNGKCSDCPPGFAKNLTPISNVKQHVVCVACSINCLNCRVQNKMVTCLVCSAAYFVFEGGCVKRSNVGDSFWGSDFGGLSNQTCVLSVASESSQQQPITFSLSQSVITTQLRIDQPHFKLYLQFYLLRVGLWSPTDRLELYLNDLLVLSKNYSDFGNQICGEGSQTDYVSFQSIQYADSNSSLLLSLEVVAANSTKRTFGVSSLRVHPVACQTCLDYPFTYKIQYSYDQGLNVVVAFSRAYKNTNSTLFKQIFQLTIDGRQLPYETVSNNSLSYLLVAYPPKESILANLSLLCLYPQLVTSDIEDPINSQPLFERVLAADSSKAKTVDNVQSDTLVTRFTPVQQPGAASALRTFFQATSRTVIYSGFIFFLLGLQTVCTHFMHNLQRIWLHVLLASFTAPPLLRHALSGFQPVRNQDIAVDPTNSQKALPLELYYNSPVYLYSYTTDLHFFRNVYSIGVAFAVFVLLLLVMHCATKKWITRPMASKSIFLRHLKVTYHRRPFFYFNSIVFYQYLSLMLACFLQFTSLNNKTVQGSYSLLTVAAAVVAFILGTVYPIFHFLWLRRKQRRMGREKAIEYANRYHQIFFRFVDEGVWEGSGIGQAEGLYNLYRFGQLWWSALVVTALSRSPQAQLYLIVITFALHMSLLLFTGLSKNLFFKVVKSLELALFVALEIIMLVCQADTTTLTAPTYNTLGHVAIALLISIILCSLARAIYNAHLLYRQYSHLAHPNKHRLKQVEVIRMDQYFSSEPRQENGQIEIAVTDPQ